MATHNFGEQFNKRMEELRKAGADVPKIVDEVAGLATIEAILEAQAYTPPNGDASLANSHLRTGSMHDHWETDSVYVAEHGHTVLANKMNYASFVNDGHRLDKHYVPGLVVESGFFERVPPEMGGMMVGTRTNYIKGLYMKEKAIDKYKETVEKELSKRIEERLKK